MPEDVKHLSRVSRALAPGSGRASLTPRGNVGTRPRVSNIRDSGFGEKSAAELLDTLGNKGFPCGSPGKESACNAGDLGSIPGLGRSLEKGEATHCSILAWRIPWTV